MPRVAAPTDDALLDAEQVKALIHRDPKDVTSADDQHGFLADAVRYLGGRRFWLRSGVAAFVRALPRENRGGTSRRTLARRRTVESQPEQFAGGTT